MESDKKRPLPLFDRCLRIALAMPLLLLGVYKICENQQIITRLNAQTEGRVVRFKKLMGSYKVAPVVAYTASHGQTYEYESIVFGSPNEYTDGQNIMVSYNPNDPEDARVKGMYYFWEPVWVIIIVWSFLSFLLLIYLYKGPN